MAQVGRISGPLLFANLERNGVNLAFRDTLNTTQLLLLDVNTGKIGINTNSPLVELNIQGDTRTTNAIATNISDVANFRIQTNNIDVNSGDIFLNAQEAIVLSNLATDHFYVSDNRISTNVSNANIDLQPNGTGTVETIGNMNVTGNIHATGNITSDGSLTFGDDDTDSVTFNAEVNSSIVPDLPDSTATYTLGTAIKRWNTIESPELTVESEITAGSINIDTLANFTLRQGNIFYVAQNGDDTARGDHPQSPFKTIKRALDAADASTEGAIVIHVFPGGYEEQLPLVVPSNVTIKGDDYRNTIIRPESAYQSEDVFHLNGESTVTNLTIKDFYYDSINDKGYAFRFAPNTVVTSRSPYVQNITVITQGTTTSTDDPRGFASGDAGKGALVDGASVLSASNEASMLFHSVTFITPGVDAITMTNGVRVEWLNSFTYFANRGLYAKNGATGHLSTDGSTIQYGAEIRSIGSANVYGNKGAEADGDDCIMYLIAHNFAYIGAGKFVDNDASRVIQSQETVELNNGKIYHVSQDHDGDFRVGDEFFIDFETGTTSLDLSAAEFDNLSSLTITSDSSSTIIRPSLIDIGNFRISGNTIETLEGAINLDSHTTNNIVFNNDIAFKKNLTITGNITVGRELITLGDTFGVDTIDFNADVNSNITPDISGYYNLGSASKKWLGGYFSEANIGDVRFVDTTVTTNISNSDLDLRASGTGRIYLPDSDLQVDNDATITGTSDIQSANITGAVTHTGDYTISNDYSSTNLNVGQNLTAGSKVQLEEILFDGNLILQTVLNNDMELRANGTGDIFVPSNNVQISNDITIGGTGTFRVLDTPNTLEASTFNTNNIQIDDNFITTTVSNSNLDFRSNGTGTVLFEQVDITGATIDLEEFAPTENIIFSATGALKLAVGDVSQRPLTRGDIRFNSEFDAFELFNTSSIALGGVYSDNLRTSVLAHPTNDTLLLNVNNVQVGSFDSDGINIHSLQVDDINIDQDTISTNVSNSDLELRPNGTGLVVIDDISFPTNKIKNNANDSVTNLANTDDGYWQFAGTSAVVVPTGPSGDRPSSPEVGHTRVNTGDDILEVWTGTSWEPAAGRFENVSVADMEDEALIQSLIYG